MNSHSQVANIQPLQSKPSLALATHPTYRPDIDGLRAVAVLLVVGFHAFPNLLHGGFIGVDVFFVISGYLISTILLENLRKETFRFSEFYARRIKRIFPALLVMLILCYGFGWFALLADEYKQLGKHIAGGAGFVSNFLFWQEAGYFDNAADTKPLLHLWSLGVEEQFYIVWPLLLWAAYKKKGNLLLTIVGVGLVSFFWSIKATYTHSAQAFYAPWTRFWELLCGSLLAWVSLYKQRLTGKVANASHGRWQWVKKILLQGIQPDNGWVRQLQSILGVLFIGVGAALLSKESRFPGVWALLPIWGAVLIVAAGSRAWINRVILANPLLVWVGLVSYPLYLWHYPLLSFARIIESKTPGVLVRVVAIVVAVGFAWLTYKFIERPLRFGVKNEKTKIIALLVCMGIVGGIGLLSYGKGGFAFRHRTFDRIQAQFTSSLWLGVRPHASIMLIGDSHAGHLGSGFMKSVLRTSITDYSKPGCMPFYGVDAYSISQKPGDCIKHMTAALDLLEKDQAMQVVIFANWGAIYLTGEYLKEGVLHRVEGQVVTLAGRPDLTDHWEIYKIGMRNTLTRLVAKNKKVIFVMDNPELDFDPRICVARPLRFWGRMKNPCSVPRESFERRASAYRQLVMDVLKDFPQVTVFDAAQKLCDAKQCWALKDGKMLYRDTHHLSEDGAMYLTQFLEPIIRESLRN